MVLGGFGWFWVVLGVVMLTVCEVASGNRVLTCLAGMEAVSFAEHARGSPRLGS